jgi:hypothetical protein
MLLSRAMSYLYITRSGLGVHRRGTVQTHLWDDPFCIHPQVWAHPTITKESPYIIINVRGLLSMVPKRVMACLQDRPSCILSTLLTPTHHQHQKKLCSRNPAQSFLMPLHYTYKMPSLEPSTMPHSSCLFDPRQVSNNHALYPEI